MKKNEYVTMDDFYPGMILKRKTDNRLCLYKERVLSSSPTRTTLTDYYVFDGFMVRYTTMPKMFESVGRSYKTYTDKKYRESKIYVSDGNLI